jgi:putative Mg2+ transporter-C (MgtC) family protein
LTTLRDSWFIGLHDPSHYVRVLVRLTVALVLGGILGFEREEVGKAAGLRTHMLVDVGAALFIIVPIEAGIAPDQLMRVVQGLTMALGFLGGGVILKLTRERRVEGITTAANLWVAAAVGMAVGMGFVWPAAYVVLLTVFVLVGMRWLERRFEGDKKKSGPH